MISHDCNSIGCLYLDIPHFLSLLKILYNLTCRSVILMNIICKHDDMQSLDNSFKTHKGIGVVLIYHHLLKIYLFLI